MAIRITSKKDGFRRAGMEHSSTPKEYPNDRFTPEQLAALKAESMLVVEELADPESAKTETDDDTGGKGKGKGKKD